MTNSIEDLPLDVFELVDQGYNVESLTAGHGMAAMGASACSLGCSCCICFLDS